MMLLLFTNLSLSLATPSADIGRLDMVFEQVAAMCSLSGERAGRQFKTCSYRCDDTSSFSLTVSKGETCPFVMNR